MAGWAQIDQFLSTESVENALWFIGGAEKEPDTTKSLVSDAMAVYADMPVGIITGGTESGIPEIAAREAKEHDLTTLGVYPERGEEYALDGLNDFEVCVSPRYGPSRWGDESHVGAEIADGVIMIGGGKGTAVEYNLTAKINEKKLREGETPAYIVAVAGTGGEADALNRRRDYFDAPYTPAEPISDATTAAEFIRENITGRDQQNEPLPT